jgi:hypothetical protein
VRAVFVVEASPKFQKRLVIVPVELSVKVTVKGFNPLVGLATKSATGITAPTPVTGLTLLPASLKKTTALLKDPVLPGVKRMVIFVEEKPEMRKAELETIEKGPAFTLTSAFVIGTDPELVATKVRCAFVPTATVPKSRLAGDTERFGGTNPLPVTVFVLLPPLLEKMTTLLKAPTVAGLKLTTTEPV